MIFCFFSLGVCFTAASGPNLCLAVYSFLVNSKILNLSFCLQLSLFHRLFLSHNQSVCVRFFEKELEEIHSRMHNYGNLFIYAQRKLPRHFHHMCIARLSPFPTHRYVQWIIKCAHLCTLSPTRFQTWRIQATNLTFIWAEKKKAVTTFPFD